MVGITLKLTSPKNSSVWDTTNSSRKVGDEVVVSSAIHKFSGEFLRNQTWIDEKRHTVNLHNETKNHSLSILTTPSSPLVIFDGVLNGVRTNRSKSKLH